MNLEPNITAPDAFYTAIVKSTEGLSETECHAAMLRLVILLANQVGDDGVLFDCLGEAIKSNRQEDKT